MLIKIDGNFISAGDTLLISISPLNAKYCLIYYLVKLLFEPPCEIPVFRISDQVRHKPGFTTTQDGKRLEISHLGSIWIVLSM